VDLEGDERLIFSGHPSWRSILGYYLKGLLVAAVAGALAALVTRIADDHVKGGWVAAAAVAVLAVVLLVGLLKRMATTYTISTHRLHIRRGIISRRIQQTTLDRVQNVNTRQSVLERLLQVGSVDFDTAGSGDYDFTFAGVGDPEEVVRAVHEAQREAAGGSPGEAPLPVR
jgi:uncharacterized membrane protein YdbT with pleckstrin-like domain